MVRETNKTLSCGLWAISDKYIYCIHPHSVIVCSIDMFLFCFLFWFKSIVMYLEKNSM